MATTPEQITVKRNLLRPKLESLDKFITEGLRLETIEPAELEEWRHQLLPVIHCVKAKPPDGHRWCGNLIKDGTIKARLRVEGMS